MNSFRFPLRAVLTVRLNQETIALAAFVSAQAGFEKIAARFRELQQEIEDAFAFRRNAFKSTASSEEVQQMQKGIRALHEAFRRCQAELHEAQASLEEKSRALLDAKQKREVVEKVQQKQLARHQLRAARVEQKTLDDLATLKSLGNLALKWK